MVGLAGGAVAFLLLLAAAARALALVADVAERERGRADDGDRFRDHVAMLEIGGDAVAQFLVAGRELERAEQGVLRRRRRQHALIGEAVIISFEDPGIVRR